jgi:hypothetical protein
MYIKLHMLVGQKKSKSKFKHWKSSSLGEKLNPSFIKNYTHYNTSHLQKQTFTKTHQPHMPISLLSLDQQQKHNA